MKREMYLDGEMPVVVLACVDNTARVLHEDTGRAWWVAVSRLTPVAGDGATATDGDVEGETRPAPEPIS